MDDDGIRWWHDLNRDQVAGIIEDDPVVVLPVAAVEQHGPHLPLSTDADIGRGLLGVAFGELDDAADRVLALPPLAVGTSGEHAAFPGTLGVLPSVLEETVVGIGASVARAGVRRLVLSNSHGGNRAALDLAALRLRREWDLLVVKAQWSRFPRPAWVALPESEWDHGLHGGALETAMMLHLRPALVDTEATADFGSLGRALEEEGSVLRPEGPANFAWLAGDLNASGAAGDATLADATMGHRLLDHYGGFLARILEDAARFPLDRLTGPGG